MSLIGTSAISRSRLSTRKKGIAEIRPSPTYRYGRFEIYNAEFRECFAQCDTRDESSSLKQFIGLIRATIDVAVILDVCRFSSRNMLSEKLFIRYRLSTAHTRHEEPCL